MSTPLQSPEVYTSLQGFGELRKSARENSPEALTAVAHQFESLFIQMMLKGMRDASFGDDIFDSDQSKFYRDLFDHQMSITMAQGKGMGLADMLVRQLSGGVAGTPNVESGKLPINPIPAAQINHVPDASKAKQDSTSGFDNPVSFIKTLWPLAEQTAHQLGVAPKILLAQAALETGWGKAVIRHPDGRLSNNLFNIKADSGWRGDKVALPALEFKEGVAVRKTEQFRSYTSFADSFKDYANFLNNNPRYHHALRNVGNPDLFIKSLQEAGYATDPDYAVKINRLINDSPIVDTIATL